MNQYKLLQLIAKGSTAFVFKAQHHVTKKEYAVKAYQKNMIMLKNNPMRS